MPAYCSSLFPLLHEPIRRYAPWHQFVQGPDFPKCGLYNSDPVYETEKIISVEARYDDDFGRIPSSIKTTTDKGTEASFELKWDDSTKIMEATFLKNGNPELTAKEWFDSNGSLFIDSSYHPTAGSDCQIRIAKGIFPEVLIEIDINGKTLVGTSNLGSLGVPEITYELVNELNSMLSDATVAALNQGIGLVIISAVWDQDGGTSRMDFKLPGSASVGLNAFGTALSDILGAPSVVGAGLLSGAYAGICSALVYRAETGHW